MTRTGRANSVDYHPRFLNVDDRHPHAFSERLDPIQRGKGRWLSRRFGGGGRSSAFGARGTATCSHKALPWRAIAWILLPPMLHGRAHQSQAAIPTGSPPRRCHQRSPISVLHPSRDLEGEFQGFKRPGSSTPAVPRINNQQSSRRGGNALNRTSGSASARRSSQPKRTNRVFICSSDTHSRNVDL